MKNIIVPIDFSECATNALKVAAIIAKKSSEACTITLVHVYERPIYGHMTYAVDTKENTKIRTQINEDLAKIASKDFLKGIKLRKLVLTDISVWELVNHDTVNDADIIIMGTHGVKGISEQLIGSNTGKVVRMSMVPVLTIKHFKPGFSIKNIVYASTFEEEKEKWAFKKTYSLLKAFNPQIHLVKIITLKHFESAEESTDKINKFIKHNNIVNYTINIYNDYSVKGGIISFARKTDADIVTLITHGRTGVSQLVYGSITEDMVNNTDKPVLSVRLN